MWGRSIIPIKELDNNILVGLKEYYSYLDDKPESLFIKDYSYLEFFIYDGAIHASMQTIGFEENHPLYMEYNLSNDGLPKTTITISSWKGDHGDIMISNDRLRSEKECALTERTHKMFFTTSIPVNNYSGGIWSRGCGYRDTLIRWNDVKKVWEYVY